MLTSNWQNDTWSPNAWHATVGNGGKKCCFKLDVHVFTMDKLYRFCLQITTT